MTQDELLFFPAPLLSLYDALREAVQAHCPGTEFRVSRTQISLYAGRMYGCVSLPRRKADAGKLLITFGLGRRVEHPRIFQSSEPYPGRFTHHLLCAGPSDIDEQLLAFLEEAWRFAQTK